MTQHKRVSLLLSAGIMPPHIYNHLPGPDFIDRVMIPTDRKPAVLGNLQRLFNAGRLGGTGYISIFPVDQDIEHAAGASFAMHPSMFDPETIVRLALESGCSGVASTFGVLGAVARKYAHKIPFIAKINHNEFLSYPNTYDQTLFGSVNKAFEMGAIGIGATIYWGSPESRRQRFKGPLRKVSRFCRPFRMSISILKSQSPDAVNLGSEALLCHLNRFQSVACSLKNARYLLLVGL